MLLLLLSDNDVFEGSDQAKSKRNTTMHLLKCRWLLLAVAISTAESHAGKVSSTTAGAASREVRTLYLYSLHVGDAP